MDEPSLPSEAATLASGQIPPPRSFGGSKPQLVAAVLSAILPGLGHLFLGQRRKGLWLLLILVALILGFWPLRLLRFYAGFFLLYLGWIALFLYSSCSALVARLPSMSNRVSRWWLLAVVLLALVTMDVLGIAVTRASEFKSFHVPSTSMENTIRAGDLIVADMWYYSSHSPSRQDVILFARGNTVWVKRVIAIGGDTIEGRNGKVTINNYIIAEPFVQHTAAVAFDEMNNFDPVEVPEGKTSLWETIGTSA